MPILGQKGLGLITSITQLNDDEVAWLNLQRIKKYLHLRGYR